MVKSKSPLRSQPNYTTLLAMSKPVLTRWRGNCIDQIHSEHRLGALELQVLQQLPCSTLAKNHEAGFLEKELASAGFGKHGVQASLVICSDSRCNASYWLKSFGVADARACPRPLTVQALRDSRFWSPVQVTATTLATPGPGKTVSDCRESPGKDFSL